MSENAALSGRPPLQTEIKQITGSPEGVIYAPPGWELNDTAGNKYIKQSAADLNTGWMKFSVEAP